MALNLPKLISNAVSIADGMTKSLQVSVQRHVWVGNNEWGNPIYSVTVDEFKAIYEKKAESKFDLATGAVIQTQGKLLIMEPIEANGTEGRIEPIDNRDLLILPDGTSGPIFKPEGLYNPEANKPFLIELWIGA